MDGLADGQQLSVTDFVNLWDTAVEADARTLTTKSKWPNDVWTNPNYDL